MYHQAVFPFFLNQVQQLYQNDKPKSYIPHFSFHYNHSALFVYIKTNRAGVLHGNALRSQA